jgi:hypothetical protein
MMAEGYEGLYKRVLKSSAEYNSENIENYGIILPGGYCNNDKGN